MGSVRAFFTSYNMKQKSRVDNPGGHVFFFFFSFFPTIFFSRPIASTRAGRGGAQCKVLLTAFHLPKKRTHSAKTSSFGGHYARG
jgi:hypothetical protein